MAKANRTSEQSKGIQQVGTAQGASFLQQYVEEDKSLAGLGEHMVVPRLKIIQGQSDPEMKKRFGEGSVIVRPGDALVAKDNKFLFVPQLFFVEYCLWSDRRDTQAPSILQRSYDPASDIAKRAADKDRRFEVYEGHEGKPERERWMRRYVQHFCFPGVIYGDHSLAGTPVVLSFERGEFGQGRSFIGACNMRREDDGNGGKIKVPLWAQVWALNSALRSNDQGNWYGFDYEGAGVISPDEAPAFKQAHLELSEQHAANRLRVDHGDDQDSGEAAEVVPEGGEVPEDAQY